MDIKKSLIILAVGFAMLTIGSPSWAKEMSFALMAAKAHPGASGAAVIGHESLSIRAEGLRPNAVYTVWFVNMKPKKHEAGAGNRPYMFKTDSYGNGRYESSLSESPFGKWEMLMIVLHPTGDPMDMKNMVGALSMRIPVSG